jgi:uncharacterized coiled-coil DUF342 family protein
MTTHAKPIPAERIAAARSVRREIMTARKAINTLKKACREATKDIAKRGPVIMAERCDSHGVAHEKEVPNPSLRTLRDSQATIKTLGQRLKLLEAEFKEAQRREADDSLGIKSEEFGF